MGIGSFAQIAECLGFQCWCQSQNLALVVAGHGDLRILPKARSVHVRGQAKIRHRIEVGEISQNTVSEIESARVSIRNIEQKVGAESMSFINGDQVSRGINRASSGRGSAALLKQLKTVTVAPTAENI